MLDNKGQSIIAVVAILAFAAIMLLLTLLGVPLKFSLAVLVCVTVFIVSFVNTDVALIILIFSMLLSPEFAAGDIPGRAVKVRIDDIFILVIFFGWVAKMAINKELALLRSTRLNTPILVYVLACLISTFIALIQGRAPLTSAFFYLLKYIEYFLLFFMVTNNLKTRKQAKTLIFYLLLTCFIVSIYGWFRIHVETQISAPFQSREGSRTRLRRISCS